MKIEKGQVTKEASRGRNNGNRQLCNNPKASSGMKHTDHGGGLTKNKNRVG